MSINGVVGVFLSEDFLSVNKNPDKNWEDIKHIIISLINEYYSDGKKYIYENNFEKNDDDNLDEIERKIIKNFRNKNKASSCKRWW